MKNFSVKTADFDSLSISGEAPIVQSDLGTAPNQIPLNKDLGSLAYMNAPQIEDLNVDTLELREIAAELSETAVDVFVYDTRKDSDGGAWRSRTSHTSWYNEELNTATRGGRREFPAVAVIVAEANKVTIYDGDDPDLSMWMVFKTNSGWSMLYYGTGSLNVSAVAMLNGKLCVTSNNNSGIYAAGVTDIDFVKDSGAIWYKTSSIGEYSYFDEPIGGRNVAALGLISISSATVVHHNLNDVAMTVLPNAPIDDNTGLPILTIAVATDGGVSVIKDDGSVVDIVYTNQTIESLWLKQNRIWITAGNGALIVGDIPDTDKSSGTASGLSSSINGWNAFANTNETLSTLGSTDTLTHGEAFGSDQGLNLIYEKKSNPASSLVAYTTSSYNTGWMPGDIKLAALSDTKIEKIGHKNMLTDVTSWTDMSATHSVSGNQITVTDDAADSIAGRVYKGIATTIGEEYVVSYDKITVGGNSSIFASIDETYGTNLGGGKINSGSQSFTFTATATTTYIILATQSSGGGSATFDNVSVVPVGEGELITNGTFDDGTVGWTGLSGGVLSIDNGRLKIEETTNALDAYAVNSSIISTVVGKKYIITWQFIKGTNTGFSTRFGNSGDQTHDYKPNVAGEYTDDGYYSFEFTATGTELNLSFIVNEANSYGFVDNISVRLAEPDRSVNDNGLQVFGEITKSPVAPGADLVAYSGFSENNYLMQPYNPDLDFGTGDFSVMFWQKSTTHSGQEVFFDIGQDEVFDNRYIFYRSSGTAGIQFWKRVNGVSTVILDVFDILNVGTYNFIVGTRKDGVFTFYVNGRSVGSISDTSDLTFSGFNRTCIIGNSVNGTSPVQNMALFRISATAPTAEQIARIYRDEKPLFQDGAQATLYGTSDAVTALAYDDSDDLLHVGTASGRSVFNGLKRVDNTTTAVSTAISATEGLVIEQ